MADDRHDHDETPPEGTIAALHEAQTKTFESLWEMADKLKERATLANVYAITILFSADGPGSQGYLFTRCTNASDPIEEEMLSLASRKLETSGFEIFHRSDDDDDDGDEGRTDAPELPPGPGDSRPMARSAS